MKNYYVKSCYPDEKNLFQEPFIIKGRFFVTIAIIK